MAQASSLATTIFLCIRIGTNPITNDGNPTETRRRYCPVRFWIHARTHGIFQNPDEILALMKSPRAQAAGIVYLQDELYEFQLYEGGHVWSVYGSPVACLFPLWLTLRP